MAQKVEEDPFQACRWFEEKTAGGPGGYNIARWIDAHFGSGDEQAHTFLGVYDAKTHVRQEQDPNLKPDVYFVEDKDNHHFISSFRYLQGVIDLDLMLTPPRIVKASDLGVPDAHLNKQWTILNTVLSSVDKVESGVDDEQRLFLKFTNSGCAQCVIVQDAEQ